MRVGKYKSEWDPWGSLYFPEEDKSMGGLPSKGTPSDKRLKKNKNKPPAQPSVQGTKQPPQMPPKKGK